MLLQIEHWHLGYDQILKDCRSDLQQPQDGLSGGGDGGSVWILCNADVDAMAAARILSYMFRSDGIPYQLRPCASFSSLQKSLSSKRKQRNTANVQEDNDINEDYDEDEDDDDHVRAIILLNLGGSRNLARLLEEQQQQNRFTQTKIYVMDCRRPFHLANIHAGENIVLFGDQTVVDEIPSDGDNLSGNESTSSEESSSEEDDSSSEEEGDDDESEAEFEDSDDLSRKEAKEAEAMEKKFSAGQEEESDRDYDGDLEDEDDHSNATGKKSKRRKTAHGDGGNDDSLQDDDATDEQQQGQDESEEDVTSTPAEPTLSPRKLHRQRRERLRVYYSAGSYYGSPAAFVSYHLSTQLRFGNVGDLLWLACVGVTDAYLHSRVDVTGYTALAMELSDRCDRLFPNDVYQRVSNAVYAEHLLGTDPTAINNNTATTQLRLSENGRILTEKDYRFFLLRHSSLLDSMVHSNYVSTKMKLWTNNGMQKLQELLAKMGYPLAECRQPFAFMKPKLRRRLREMIEMHAEEYGLDNFEFTSFFRITGYNSLISASDISYAVTALLEVEYPATASSKARVVTPTQDGTAGDKADETSAETEEERSIMHAFNIAYDVLNANGAVSLGPIGAEGTELSSLVNGGNISSSTGIGAGIRLALNLQNSIIATSVNLLERSAITRLRHFRYAYITCTSEGSYGVRGRAGAPSTSTTTRTPKKNHQQQESHVFAKPLALTKLAHYLMDMHRENGKWTGTKSRPLVLMAEKPQTSTYMVVGYEYPERHGHFVRNRFGEKFELVAKTMQGSFKFDSFDSNVVEVGGNDVQRFIEQLHYMMDSI